MSTPMFIREPVVAENAAIPGDDTITELVAAVTEATLIEELRYCAAEFSTDAGRLIVRIGDGTGAGSTAVGAYAIAGGGVTLEASDTIDLNLTLPVGFKLFVQHNVQLLGADALFGFAALGGIVR